MATDPIVIVAAQRTPIGAFQGALSGATATDLVLRGRRPSAAVSRSAPRARP